MSMFLSPVFDFVRAAATNLDDDDFPVLATTATEPTGNGVIAWAGAFSMPTGSGKNDQSSPANQSPNWLMIVPFGDGAEDATFSLRLSGWDRIGTMWVPVTICELACTLGASTGVDGADVSASELFADTIAETVGAASLQVISPTADQIGIVVVDALAFRKLQLTAALGTATGANALIKKL